MSVQEILSKTGPRKLLALDGGGIRGIITIEVLAKIESLLQEKLGADDKFLLADYFDYIAGTSTGAIIASCLSWGMRVSEVREFYINQGENMFDSASLLKQFQYKFEDKNLAQELREKFQEKDGSVATLGSSLLKTLLLMVMRNATTDSPWPISNNPYARYNDPSRPDCNLQLPLWQLIRASTAAPTYFPPEVIEVEKGEPFVFVDGGITSFNNPAFQLFLMATTKPYKLNWPVGEDKMLLVSVGTGMTPSANKNLKPGEMNLLYNAGAIPSALMFAAQNQQDMLCRIFGKCLEGDIIDQEVGNMIDINAPGGEKLFTYMRYNADLSHEGLSALGLTQINPADVQKMDAVDKIKELQAVGKAIADQKVKKEHFVNFL
ncbi:patatin-like phospholipase family protein [Microcystis aeruginosa LEGE 11464]|jgi:patatin-like phospholipase/acyl hydrolase|uniref:patatin-like phospholipase family protein n=1 Tax=Microcystis TaxID=1125 RepID=UPI001882E60A|nr:MULTISPECIES: patatin-like phospholipase family protein [Microcystis]MBE9091089.1 patatin-like phospholipase family protein [Microcystis aeruginosa LEGE 11464]MCA2659898.1 patatin-like phospholipase family protein [Microcystis sp. M049S2]MCZ8127511.1 patatin-like phospholipase family protein [Microcystis sp. LE19-114.1B]